MSHTASPEGHEPLLESLQRRALRYFLEEVHPETGLVADSNEPAAPCSIAAVGMALGAYAIAVRLGLLGRDEASARTLRLLRFFRDSPQDEGTEAERTRADGIQGWCRPRPAGERGGNGDAAAAV